MERLVAELRERLVGVRAGGGPEAVKKHRGRNKLTARERVERLIDPGSDFLELSPLAAFDMYRNDSLAAGILTGIGIVETQHCAIVANDATVKGGTYYPMTVKKHLRAQEIAEQNHLPCIYLVDSGGAFLPLQADVFPDRDQFGRIFYNQARMSSKRIPQIAAVMGSCTAGGAYIPAMSDETVIVKGRGTIFLGGPPLVKAATGEEVTAEELGGADVHTRISGVADHFANDDDQALAMIREIVPNLGPRATAPVGSPAAAAQVRSARNLRHRSGRRHTGYEVREIIARLVDGSCSKSSRRATADARLRVRPHQGTPVGIVANNGILFRRARTRAPTSSNCARSAKLRWCSCRTSPDSWSARSTKTEGSPGTARSS